MLLAALLLMGVFTFVIMMPCLGTSILGWKLLHRLGNHPSRTPAIHLSIVFKLIILEIISFGLLIMLYHVLADYG